jgi:hypothetical protein
MNFFTNEICHLEERVLKRAIAKMGSSRAVAQNEQLVKGAMLQLWTNALHQCADLKARIWREVRSTSDFVAVTEGKMKFREEMMQDIVRRIYGMANAVSTAVEQLEMIDRQEVAKSFENSQGLGYFDRKLTYDLGLVRRPGMFAQPHGARPSRFAEPCGA